MRRFSARLNAILVLCVCASATPDILRAAGPNDVTTTRVTVRASEVRDYDWAKLQASAQVAYVSSGPRTLSNRMIDNDLQTAFQFSTSDRSPTVILQLAKSAKLHRISTAFKAEQAKLDAYFLNELPKDAADLRFTTPDVSVVDLPDDHGMITVDFAVSAARYVVLRWSCTNWREPLAVAEISAFSNDPIEEDVRLAANTGPNLASMEPPLVLPVSP